MTLAHVVFGKFHGDYHEGNLKRIQLLYRSLDKFDKENLLQRRYVVCPSSDVDEVKRTLGSSVVILSDGDILPNIDSFNCSNWFKQQFLKLCFYRICDFSSYMTMDCDNFATKAFQESDLIRGQRSLLDFTWRFDHYHWWSASAKFLNLDSDIIPERVMHVTPCIYNRSAMSDLHANIERIYSCRWDEALLGRSAKSIFDPQWIENGIYYLNLISQNKLDQFHFSYEEFGVQPLHSEGEVWILDQWKDWDPQRCFAAESRGLFSVVQSNSFISPEDVELKIGSYFDE